MFAVRSQTPVRIERAFRGLQRLAFEHKDGWGIVSYSDAKPWTETSIRSAHQCRRFSSIARSTRATCLMAHIRIASVGDVTTENAHPFLAGRIALMHNGTIHNFAKNQAAIESEIRPEYRKELRGETDSERCFALFRTYLDEQSGTEIERYAKAVAKMSGTIAALSDGPTPAERSSLNFLVSDGHNLVATRRGRTLYMAARPGARFIASEHLWFGELWEDVPEDSLVLVRDDLHQETTRTADWQ